MREILNAGTLCSQLIAVCSQYQLCSQLIAFRASVIFIFILIFLIKIKIKIKVRCAHNISIQSQPCDQDHWHVHQFREWPRPMFMGRYFAKSISTNTSVVMRKNWTTLGRTLVCPYHSAWYPHAVTHIRIMLWSSLCHRKFQMNHFSKTLWGWCLTGLFRCTTSTRFRISSCFSGWSECSGPWAWGWWPLGGSRAPGLPRLGSRLLATPNSTGWEALPGS